MKSAKYCEDCKYIVKSRGLDWCGKHNVSIEYSVTDTGKKNRRTLMCLMGKEKN